MGQTAIISPQIIDSTSIGRDLITAADQAAAQAIIGVTGVDTGADYTWTGDHTFDGSVTLADAEWSSSDGVLNQPDINGFHYLAFNGSNVFRASALDFIPMSDGTKNLGRSDLRFADVFSVDGDFSGTVSTDTISSSTGLSHLSFTGSVVVNRPMRPDQTGIRQCGLSSYRWSEVYSVDGSFSGPLVSEAGGSYKLYNLGSEGDTDTEYFETSFNNYLEMETKKTGSGAGKGYKLIAGTSRIQCEYSGNVTLITPTASILGNLTCSGNMTLSNLPTSDPAVAGRLWNDSGTVKISAG